MTVEKYDVYSFWPKMFTRDYTWWATILGEGYAEDFKDIMLPHLPQQRGSGVSIVKAGGEPWDGEHYENGDTL